jgi:hypothetical protein
LLPVAVVVAVVLEVVEHFLVILADKVVPVSL